MNIQRVRELFDAALALEPSQRASFLAHADPDLRREVELLLDFDAASPAGSAGDHAAVPATPGLTRGGGLSWLASDLADDLSGPSPEPIPPRIGRFRVLREIGRGGMGVVYEAQQEDPDRRVALKVIHPGLISRGLLRRFRQETRAMAQLRHPGVAQIYEAGASVEGDAESRPYFVMELVEGLSITKFAAAQGLDSRARLELIARVCDALHHAHQKGVVHRDLKPDNILVQAPAGAASPDAPLTHAALSSEVQPKILDFGVARLAAEPETGSLRTQQGQIVGTIPYLSPEQALGESAVADIRSDIYSVGVIAYEMLSGRLPFDTGNRPIWAAVNAVVGSAAPRLLQLVRDLDPDIDTIIHTAMERQPERRYQSAADMAADIRRYLASQPIIARPPSTLYLARKFVERNRALSGVVAGSALLIVAALVVISTLWVQSLRAERQAVWHRYRSAMSAVGFALQAGEVGIAHKHLRSTDPQFRGWEYRHFLARVDQSRSAVTPVDSGSPVSSAGGDPFLVIPERGAPGGIVLFQPEHSTLLWLSPDERARPVAIDQRLALYYAARAGGDGGLSFWLTLQSDRLFVPGDAGSPASEPRACPRVSWPFDPGERVYSPRLSRNGRVLCVLRDGDRGVVVADVTTGEVRLIPLPRGISGMRTAISADGSRLAVSNGFLSSLPLRVGVFDSGSGVETSVIADPPSEVSSLMLSERGDRVYAAFHDGSLGLWDVSVSPARRMLVKRLDIDRVENLTLSPDGSLLAAGTADGGVLVFDSTSLENTHTLIGHEYEVHDIRFLPPHAPGVDKPGAGVSQESGADVLRGGGEGGGGGDQVGEEARGGSAGLISTGRDGSIRRWSLDPLGANPRVMPVHAHLVHALALADKGRFLVTGSWDRSVAILDLDSGRERARVATTSFVQELALSPDERWIASREFSGEVRVIDAVEGTEVACLSRAKSGLDQPFFDSTSQRLLFDFDPAAGKATWWDLSSRTWIELPSSSLLAFEAAGLPSPASALNTRLGIFAFSETRKGRLFAVLHDLRSGKEVFAIPTRRTAGEAIAFTPDGRAVAAADDAHHIQLYELPSGRRIGTFAGHIREVLGLVFSPDGSRLFSADYTGTIWVWDVPSRESITQLRGHTAHIRRLVISGDGRTLYSGARDGTVRVWGAPGE